MYSTFFTNVCVKCYATFIGDAGENKAIKTLLGAQSMHVKVSSAKGEIPESYFAAELAN